MRTPARALALSLLILIPTLAIAETSKPASAPAPATRQVGDLGKVGDIQFPTSCDPALQPEFERGLALLHSFFYEEARRVFSAVAEKDPECAMAHWGVAMTYYHPLWALPDSADLAAGQAAVTKAQAAKKQDERETAYVRAAEAFYTGLDEPAIAPQASAPSCHAPGAVDLKSRAMCFRREMEKVSASHPKDLDAAAFYALSLVATAPPGDPELKQQKQAAEILETWYRDHHNHPGLAHYLIHSYDYPPLATKGLPAALAYADIAPLVPHALHMPSHIFTRLGMWKETIESNLASAEAAHRYAAQYYPGATLQEELHSLDYVMYAYLQTGQDRKATEVMARLNAVEKTFPTIDFAVAYAIGAMPARYALERRQWKEAAALELRPMPFWSRMPFSEGLVVYARAVGAARSGDLPAARAAAGRLQELVAASTEARFKYFADQMEIQRQAALALIAMAEGHKAEGIAQLRMAAVREDSLGKHPVSPGALLPVRELLADALLETGSADEALAEFQASLKIYPGRFNATYGAARAAAKSGKKQEARKYYEGLMALAKMGDSARPELGEARKFIAGR
jgi:tetratricopeptide (TPR) repeat protein